MPVPNTVGIGSVHLRVSNLERSVAAYAGVMGFHVERFGNAAASFSAGKGTPPLVVVHESAGATPRPDGTTGLFHVAIRFPDRPSLADMLSRLVRLGYPLHGAAHHGVSEALYLADPDGNGIEFYRDLPRTLWPESDEGLHMVTAPLDIRALLKESRVKQQNDAELDPATDVGHIHLQVSNLGRAERFYCDALGFQVRQRSFPGALFVAAEQYHHHIGLNVWAGEGAPAPPPGSLGVESYDILLPNEDRIDARRVALMEHGYGATVEHATGANVLVTRDPDGTVIRLVPGTPS